MLKIILVGCSGKMGAAITAHIGNSNDLKIIAGVDKFRDVNRAYPIYENISDITEPGDVIIDFSNPDSTDATLSYAESHGIAAVIGTTGLSKAQEEAIQRTSKKVPIFSSFNMSLGVNLLLELSKKAAAVLGADFDIEIIEEHHNQKIDAPSGTAYMLANAMNEVRHNTMRYQYDRHATRAKREPNEIGIHSVRGGNIVGEHEVIFAGNDEIIKLSHSARSKNVFAVGAVSAARFISRKPAGLYSMKEMIEEG